jgi:hypothetical protein
MRTQVMLAAGLLLSGLLAAAAVAVEKGPATAQPTDPTKKQATQQAVSSASKVPQAQIDTVKKREAAKKRRDELLKVRDRNAGAN